MDDANLFLELKGKYRIIAQLGEGGTARVWLALAKGPGGFQKLVVLKGIRRELLGDQEVVDMFLHEARLAARLNHPNVAQTNQVLQPLGQPVLVMEYLEGVPFSAVLERQREGNELALAMLLRVLSDALAGLHAAHELTDYDGRPLGVVHRDATPQNLFITFAGQVKVLDFGIAQLGASDLREKGVVRGKLRYLAPEQLSRGRLDRRADIYAMGVILWEVATARRMFTGLRDSEVIAKIHKHELPRAGELKTNIDAALLDIIDHALAFDPNERFATALDFQTALDHYISTLGAPLRNQDVGRALSKMFEDVRLERAETIERRLSETDEDATIGMSSHSLPELTSFTNTTPSPDRSATRAPLSTALLVSVFAAASLIFGVGLGWPELQVWLSSDNQSHAAPEVPSRPIARVKVRITAFPKGARIFLDGRELNENPFEGNFPVEPVITRVLRVKATGKKDYIQNVVFDRERDIVVRLSPLMPEIPPPTDRTSKGAPETPSLPAQPSAHRAPAPALSELPTSSSKAIACSPPYYFDDRGIKKYKRACLSKER